MPTRTNSFLVAAVLIIGCAKEPSGTPIEPSTAGATRGAKAQVWVDDSVRYENEERWGESLFASQQALKLVNECIDNETDDCVLRAPGMAQGMLWSRWRLELYARKSRAHLALNHPKPALAAADDAIRFDPGNTFILPYYNRAEAYLAMGSYEKALEAAKLAVQNVAARGYTGRSLIEAQVYQAEALAKLKRFDEARPLLESVERDLGNDIARAPELAGNESYQKAVARLQARIASVRALVP